MKTQKQIRERIAEIQTILDEAELKEYSNKVIDYATHRRYNTQINTLIWVLDETKTQIRETLKGNINQIRETSI